MYIRIRHCCFHDCVKRTHLLTFFICPCGCRTVQSPVLVQLYVACVDGSAGDRRYRGGIDCSLAPDRHLDLHRLIRVGFLHKQSQQDSDTYLAANGQQVACFASVNT